jgi:hypothetical protein
MNAQNEIEPAPTTLAGARREAEQRLAVAEFNQVFGYDLRWPLDEFAARNAAEIAHLRGRAELAQLLREAFSV